MLYIEITIEFNQKRRRIKKAKKKSRKKYVQIQYKKVGKISRSNKRRTNRIK